MKPVPFVLTAAGKQALRRQAGRVPLDGWKCLQCKQPMPDDRFYALFCSTECREAHQDIGHGE